MIKLLEAAQEIQKVCTDQKWKFCFIGGLTLQRWGEPRVTQDVDLTLLTGFGIEEKYIHILLKHFRARVEKPEEFALENRVVLLLSSKGIGIDIALAGFPFEESAVARSSAYEFLPGIFLRTCSAEDLIVFKAFADRPRDWIDIEGILVRQTDCLDWSYIKNQLEELVKLKEAPEIMSRLEQLRIDCRNLP